MNPRLTCLAVFCVGLLAALSGPPAFCQAQKPQLVVQIGHTASVLSVAFSPDGKILASSSTDYTVKLWATGTGEELRTLSGSNLFVNSVAFSPDGKILAGGSRETILLWDTATGNLLQTLIGHVHDVNSVAFSPDGKTLASGSDDNTIKIWDTVSGQLQRTLIGYPHGVTSVAFSPDGKTLVGGSWDSTIKIWDAVTGKLLHTLTGHTTGYKRSVTSVAFSPDGKTLASGSNDSTIKLWNAVTGRWQRTLIGHRADVNSVAFSPDGETLASGSNDGTVIFWDTATGKLMTTLTGDVYQVTSVAFSPDGKTLADGNDDHTIKMWDAVTGQLLRTLAGHTRNIQTVALSRDGKALASGGGDKTVMLWNIVTGRLGHTLTGHTDEVHAVAFSPDGHTLASGSGNDDDTIKLWDALSGQLQRTLPAHTRGITSLAFSPDGKTLASSSGSLDPTDRNINLWDTATGKELPTFARHLHGVASVAFSPDGKTLASGGGNFGDDAIQIWNAMSGQLQHTLTRHVYHVNSVAFSPDGRTLASGHEPHDDNDPTIKIWDTVTGQLRHTLHGHPYAVNSVAFSPDGKTLASGSNDCTIKLWDTATWKLLRTLTGHTNFVTSVCFSPDGKTLISGSWDSTIKIWDAGTGQELASLYALGEGDWAVVDPQGRFDASPGGMTQMHYVVGLEPVDLSQLKERYYEPGLLAKIMGFDKTPLRDVPAFDDVRLYPRVDVEPLAPGSRTLTVRLTNQGGGIGPVQVYVNGQIYTEDARPKGTDPDVPKLTLAVNLSGVPNAKPGQANAVKVVALNYDPRTKQSYLQSRGVETVWSPAEQAAAPPVRHLYGIIAGVSDYASPSLRLGFAAKDADSFAGALELAAGGLFTPAHVHITRLNTTGKPGTLPPTKANIQKAFAAVRSEAGPDDILVVYLAGHGIALPAENSLYCYLTADARTGDTAALNDPEVREQTTVTSRELADWIKDIKANYRVMVLDTCAAGAAATQMAQVRALDGDQIRAMDRFEGRTGFHVLMGCASDAVSYEASRYGQGLLTYCLLQGMRGAALDNSLVDVSKLFTYAEDAVPTLVRSENGGIQQPFYQKPEAGSFDIGELSEQARTQIPLQTPRPQLVRPTLFDPGAGRDDLHLSDLLRQTLRDQFYASARGGDSAPLALFVDTDTMPGAVLASGTYAVTGSAVSVSVTLFRDDKKVSSLPLIEGTSGDLPGLASKLASAVTAAAAKL